MKDFSKKIALLLLLPCVFSPTGRAQVPDEINLNKELVAFYPFNGNDDDESGNGNDLKSFDEENAFSFDRNVHPNKAASFNNNSLALVDDEELLQGNSDFTISIWGRLNNANKKDPLRILFANDTINGFELSLNKWTGGRPVPEFNIGGRLVFGAALGSGKMAMPLNFWHHLALTREDEKISLFLNNTLVAEGVTNLPINGKWLFFGGRQKIREGVKNSHSWTGELDEIRIYRRALSAPEMSALYEVDKPLDADGDGFTNWDEVHIYKTNPELADTDEDWLSDGVELNVLNTDPLKADTDGDGVTDGDEDSDSDGLSNANELNLFGTNPLNGDTDGDGLSDGEEANIHDTDPLLPDTDGDGLTDTDEIDRHKTDPNSADTDARWSQRRR